MGDVLSVANEQIAPKRIGLIAGWGRYPIAVAEILKEQGYRLYCVALEEHADPKIVEICDHVQWTGIAKIGAAIRYLQRNRIENAVMAGKVFKVRLFQPRIWLKLVPDWRTIRIFWAHFITTKKDRKDDTLLRAIVDAFATAGIAIRPATDFAPGLLVPTGRLTRLGPSRTQQADIAFGWELAKEIGRLDIGQSVCVKDRACLAVEAIEGTDECIKRAGQLCPAGGFTVVKLAKPQQDMRFDVPTIGLGTLRTMVEAGAKMLVVEAEKTILVDAAAFTEFANRHQLIVVTVAAPAETDKIAAAA
jgi:UDP-2,3-diacylglucosamine hydrolase